MTSKQDLDMNDICDKIVNIFRDHINEFTKTISTQHAISEEDIRKIWNEQQSSSKKSNVIKKKRSYNRTAPPKKNAYFIFCNEQRSDIKKSFEDKYEGKELFSMTNKELSKRWKNLNEEDKKKYKDIANKDSLSIVNADKIDSKLSIQSTMMGEGEGNCKDDSDSDILEEEE